MSKEFNILDKSISPRRMVLTLVWPTVVEQLLMSVVTYVDAAMVGSVGVNATAAIAVNTSVMWLINGLIGGLGVGASVLVAKKIGEQKLDEGRMILRQSIFAMVIMGIVFTLIGQFVLSPYLAKWMGAEEAILKPASDYMRIVSGAFMFQVFLGVGGAVLRGTGDTKTPMRYNLLSNGLNLLGNFLFIYPTRKIAFLGLEFTMWGAGMGAAGAAIGTALAYTTAGLMTLIRLFSPKCSIHISIKDSFKIDWKILRQIIGLGLPSAFERVTLSSGQLVTTSLVTGQAWAAAFLQLTSLLTQQNLYVTCQHLALMLR